MVETNVVFLHKNYYLLALMKLNISDETQKLTCVE